MKKILFPIAIVVLLFAFSSTSILAQQAETKKHKKVKITKTEQTHKAMVKPKAKKETKKATEKTSEKASKKKAKTHTRRTKSKNPTTHKVSKIHKSKKMEKTTPVKN